MYYFGYGSNMLTRRLRDRVPSAEPITVGTIPGRALRFHKRSRDGSAKCNLVSTSNDESQVYGVVFDLSPNHLEALDEAEQRGRGYVRKRIQVETDPSPLEAFAYVAQPAYLDDALLPYEWYHALVVAGAREHALPSPYIAQLKSVRTYPDPNGERRQQYQTLLHEAGYPLLEP